MPSPWWWWPLASWGAGVVLALFAVVLAVFPHGWRAASDLDDMDLVDDDDRRGA